MYLPSCVNTHHDVTNLEVRDMVGNAKNWIIQEPSMTFLCSTCARNGTLCESYHLKVEITLSYFHKKKNSITDVRQGFKYIPSSVMDHHQISLLIIGEFNRINCFWGIDVHRSASFCEILVKNLAAIPSILKSVFCRKY